MSAFPICKIRGFEFTTNKLPTAKLPTRNDKGSSGYDFYSPIETVILPGDKVKIYTGIKSYMKQDEELLLFIRSSLAIKFDLSLANDVGKVDSSYFDNPDNEGEIIVALKNNGQVPYKVNIGDKICQGTFYKYLTADKDEVINKTRNGGVGSSGK